jgi:hypothetical protein
MNECVIAIAPNGETQLRVVLDAAILKAKGKAFSRPRNVSVEDNQLQLLRYGDADPQLVDEVRAKLSEWFLSTDLGTLIGAAVDLSEGEQIRLVFRVDENLRESLADVPFELIGLKGSTDALVLSPRIASLVHILDKEAGAPTKTADWPLKILIVRSNPHDLGGEVPAAKPIYESLLKIIADEPALKPELMKVDILSSEGGDGFAGRPTVDDLETQLGRVKYDILIYLGHGDVSQNISPTAKVGGVLQLEDETGKSRSTLQAGKLAGMLGEENPVPVVLLLGCLTASENLSEAIREAMKNRIPQWLRGSQGVAQVLISSASGVQFVVGMRYKIDTTDAVDFLNFFFRSLFISKPGNVEAGVRSARRKLAEKSYMWSAPVVFSALSEEPLFPFMEDPPSCPSVETYEATRSLVWRYLAKAKWSLRDQESWKDLVKDSRESLDQNEQEIAVMMNTHNSALITPGFTEFKPGEEIRVPVKLFGALKDVEEIEGKITVTGVTLPVTTLPVARLEASKLLSDSKFELDSLNNNSGFRIKHSSSKGNLESGHLFDIVMTVPPETQGVLPVSISKVKTKPQLRLCNGNNAIVLPLP